VNDTVTASAEAAPSAATIQPAPALSTDAGQLQTEVAKQPDGQLPKDGTADAAKDAPKPEQSRYDKKIGSLTAKLRDSQRQLARSQDLIRKIGSARQLNPLDFKSDAEYHAALIDNTVKQTEARHARADAEAVSREMARAENEIWEASVEEYSSTIADFDSVVYSDAVKLPGNIMREMRTIPGGPAVAYFLAKNQGESHRIAQLPKQEALIELGRLAGRLTATQPKRVTSATDPPRTVQGGSTAAILDPSKMSMAEYSDWTKTRGKKK